MHLRASLIGIAAGLAGTLAAAPAQAAFPGSTGRIVYEDVLSSGFYTVNPDGSGWARILAAEGTGTDDPRYSPDGRLVLYARNLNLWVVDANGGTPRAVTTGGHNDQKPAFSPDGTQVVFRRVAADDLHVVNLDGSGLRNLTNDGGISQESEPAWSPDGARIAYELGRSSGQGSIYAIGADGSAPTNLTPENPTTTCDPDHFRRSRDPSWSPDGQRIAFTGSSICRGTTPQYGSDIWLMNPDGGGKVNIVANDGPSEQEPHWSPDGSRIAVVSDQESIEGPGDIFLMAPDGSGRTKVIDREIKGEDIDWGPATPPPPPPPPPAPPITSPPPAAPRPIVAANTAPALAFGVGATTLRRMLLVGLPITVRTNENARLTVVLQVPRASSRRLRAAGAPKLVTVGRLSRTVQRGTSKVRVRVSRTSARRLRALRRLTLTVRMTLKDGAGLATTRTTRVRLRR